MVRNDTLPSPSAAACTALWLLMVMLVACAAEVPAAPTSARLAPSPLPNGARTLVVMGAAELVALTAVEAPPGGDGPTQLTLALVRGDHVAPLALPSPAIYAAAWARDAVVLSADGTLRRLGADGSVTLVARDLVTEPALSAHGLVLAYVAHDGDLAYALRVIEAGQTRTIARDVPSAGALRFAPDARALVFVGRSTGGVAGLHTISLETSEDATRCLTNCTLITGQPWGEEFVPLPAGTDALHFDGDEVFYEGVRVRFRSATVTP
jgi:hypothetical protein